MAGIEKICEFSGEYPSCAMYGYKRNSIQIMPEYRKQFRGAEHTLFVFKPEEKFKHKHGGWFESKKSLEVENRYWEPGFKSLKERDAFYHEERGYCTVNQWDYVLQVVDPALLGQVGGMYHNFSYDISAVKRKLKRLLRAKKLNIVYLDKTRNEAFENSMFASEGGASIERLADVVGVISETRL